MPGSIRKVKSSPPIAPREPGGEEGELLEG
jgi:hypothetical protein